MATTARMRRAYDGVRSRAVRVWTAVAPGRRAWTGAAVGVALGTTLVVLAVLWFGSTPNGFSAGNFLGLLLVVGMLVAAGVGALVGVHVVRALPTGFRWAFGISAVLLAMILDRAADDRAVLILDALVIAPFAVLGAGVWVFSRGGLRDTTRLQRAIAAVGTVAAIVFLAFALAWIRDDGVEAPEYVNAALAGTMPPHLQLPDPSSRGPYGVLSLTYGSGEDPRRPEFGAAATLVTESVDGSKLLDGWEGWSGRWRSRYWGGIDPERLPVQGRVWYPDGDGAFPLVLTVHGNHSMEDVSDPGYAYLGELMASRGFILVSVDENFLNGSTSSLLSGLDGGLEEENDARGWMLLEHLRVWHEWNAEAGHPFEGKVDTERIGLIGHSRGGEAVGIAAAFNLLPYYPDDATLEFDYGYAIRGVVAIAPVYGQYRPTGLRTPIRDVSYLVLHGANDGDVTSFTGQAQLDRVSFTDDRYRFKAGLYVLGANHGQFNTTWGRKDSSEPWARFLNLEPLMPAGEQQQVAQVYISAFLEATLHDELGYLPLFLDWRVGADWLPDTVYLNRFADSRTRPVATFDEDIDVASTTLPGGAIRASDLTVWREERVGLKYGTKESNGVYIGWSRGGDDAGTDAAATEVGGEAAPERAGRAGPEPGLVAETEVGDRAARSEASPSYTIRLPADLELDPAHVLVLALADASEDPTPQQAAQEDDDEGKEDEGREEQGARADDELPEPIDLTIELADAAGRAARLALSRHSPVQPRIEVQVRKAEFLESGAGGEAVFQTFALPLAEFLLENPELEVGELAAIRLVFDRTAEGVVIVDEVGFWLPPPAWPGAEAVAARPGQRAP